MMNLETEEVLGRAREAHRPGRQSGSAKNNDNDDNDDGGMSTDGVTVRAIKKLYGNIMDRTKDAMDKLYGHFDGGGVISVAKPGEYRR